MTSRKPASSKRAAPPRACDYTRAFVKDWERLSRSGRHDLTRLKAAMLLLIGNDQPLGPEWLENCSRSEPRAVCPYPTFLTAVRALAYAPTPPARDVG